MKVEADGSRDMLERMNQKQKRIVKQTDAGEDASPSDRRKMSQNFMISLQLMWQGMLGLFVVQAILVGVVYLMGKIFK